SAVSVFLYTGEKGVYTISLCDCGKYSASTPNPYFDAEEDDVCRSGHYRHFFSTVLDGDDRLWFFNVDR
nr:hypothetical protein [Bacteroidales bacterium]